MTAQQIPACRPGNNRV